MQYVKWYKDTSQSDRGILGIKATTLGELWRAQFPVPSGFFVTAEAFREFLRRTGLHDVIAQRLKDANVLDADALNSLSKDIQMLITKQNMPDELREEIADAYSYIDTAAELRNVKTAHELIHVNRSPTVVMVRSSPVGGGQQSAYAAGLTHVSSVCGQQQLLEAVMKCWASIFSADILSAKGSADINSLAVALVIQKQVDSEKNGIAYSVNPKDADDTKFVIETVYGLGNTAMIASTVPHTHIVDKASLKVLDEIKSSQRYQFKRDEVSGKTVKLELSDSQRAQDILSDREIEVLCRLIKRADEHFKQPRCLEWAVEKNKLYVLQSKQLELPPKPVVAVQRDDAAELATPAAGQATSDSARGGALGEEQQTIGASRDEEPAAGVLPKLDTVPEQASEVKVTLDKQISTIKDAIKTIKEQLARIESVLFD